MKQQLNEVKRLQKIAGIVKEAIDKPGQKLMGLDLVRSKLGDTTDADTLAMFLYSNYGKVTGRKQSDRNLEERFPEVFEDIMDYYKIDFMEFQDAWDRSAG